MGLHFGELAFLRGIVYYRLMPNECRPFAKMVSEGLPNVFKRFRMSFLTWLPPLGAGTLIGLYLDYVHKLSKRKNPKDYINEVDPNIKVEEVEEKKEKCKKKKDKKESK